MFRKDPFVSVLKHYAPIVRLGVGDPSHFDRAMLVKDLNDAIRRNSIRFFTVLGVLVLWFIGLCFIGIFGNIKSDARWLFGCSGGLGGALVGALLYVARSWWRADTFLTVAKYAQPEDLSIFMTTLLHQGTKPIDTGEGRTPPSATRKKTPTKPRAKPNEGKRVISPT